MLTVKQADGHRKPGLAKQLHPVFLDGVPYCGVPTQVFAYQGQPVGVGKHPAILLVHGGAGRAYDDWAAMWTRRGFVALAPDLNAQMYGVKGDFTPNPKGGPRGYGSFGEDPDRNGDTWAGFCVNLLRACADYLSTREDVDQTRIFVHGISWGGYLTYLLLGSCHVFALAGVSYTTAYLYRDEYWIERGLCQAQMGDCYHRWVARLDPAGYIGAISTPTVWARGINDTAFSTELVNDTLDLFRPGLITPVFYPEYQHSQEHGSCIPEIVTAIEDAAFGRVHASGEETYSVVYTRGGNRVRDWGWIEEAIPASEYGHLKRPEWTAWYYNRRDRRKLITSTRIYRHGI